MKWKIDFDDLDDAQYDLEGAIEVIEEFITNYSKLSTSLLEESTGQFFDAVMFKIDKEVTSLQKIKKRATSVNKSLKKYIEEIDDANPWSGQGIYKVNSELANKKINKLEKELETDLVATGRNINNYIVDYEDKIRKFNSIDSSIDLEQEYKEEIDIIDYINERREEIAEETKNFKRNDELLEDVVDKIKKLEKKLDNLI